MSVENHPFANPPRLPSPTKGRVRSQHHHSRTLSRSPVRQNPRDIDPILRNLSPTSTLRAFVTDPSTMSNSDALFASIQHSSVSERALGAKAAQACLDLRNWTHEMQRWEWPGTFDVPEPARKRMRMSTLSLGSVLSEKTIDTQEGEESKGIEEEEYWGSLPARTVEKYEKRADEVGQQLDQIDVEELKEYVLVSHYRADSRASSRNGMIGDSNVLPDIKRLDDFTALVTATILQALPYISQLNRLLDVWTIRLMILRSASRYLRDLKRARTDLDHGWGSIAVSTNSAGRQGHADFDRNTMLQMKAMIEQQVGSLGRRLDRFLDDLEGRDDTVPDRWIDDFESLEAAYGSWLVQAERKVLENEWRARRASVERPAQPVPEPKPIANKPDIRAAFSELEDPLLDHDAVMRASMDVAEYNVEARNEAVSLQDQATDGRGQLMNRQTQGLDTISIPPLLPTDVEDGGELADLVNATASISRASTPASDSGLKEDGIGQVAKRRAAFLNGIEKTNSLNMSKSPVRPFEHASNAFTRLFKKDRTPEQQPIRRTASGRLSSADSLDRERKPLTPVSANGPSSGDSKVAELRSPSSHLSRSASASRIVEEPTGEGRHLNSALLAVSDRGLKSSVGENLRPGHSAAGTKSQTRLSSPFRPPDDAELPENWPLRSTPAQDGKSHSQGQEEPGCNGPKSESDSGPETNAPSTPLESDAFDRMFVQSLPSTPDSRPRSSRAPLSSDPWPGAQKRAASLPRSTRSPLPDMPKLEIPASYLDMLSKNGSRVPQSSSRPASAGQSKSRSAGIGSSTQRSTIASADRPSTQTPRTKSPPTQTPVSPALDSEDSEAPAAEAEAEVLRPHVINRASIASIEAFPRSQLKSVDVHRSSRQGLSSPKTAMPHTPKSSSDSIATENANAMEFKSLLAFPTPPTHSRESTPVSGRDTPTVLRGATESSPFGAGVIDTPSGGQRAAVSAPLNAAMTKRRAKNILKIEDEGSLGMSMKKSRTNQTEYDIDRLDRHVSNVLNTLSGPIRFKPRAGGVTPVPSNDARALNGSGAKQPTPRRLSKSASMTIAPAETESKKSTSSAEPEVRIYHLTQLGREEQPMKLFVRLVGENERVMVRVGGGWADLADFLRQYADHHGSRTVSEGTVEIQTVPHAHSRKVSGPAEFRAKTPSTPTEPGPRPSSKDSDKDWPHHTQNGHRIGDGRSTPGSEWHNSSSPPDSTPKSTSTGSSRPGTANVSRPPSRQDTGEVGLAGPSSGKKAGLSEHKAKWVEGMIERAKKASAEKSKEDREKHFGELGKAGGTRRVVFRSGSGPATDGKSK